MATIRFPQTQIYDKEAKAVNFQAHLDKDTISCSLSLDALQDHFLGDIFKPLQAFICNRPAIEHIAKRLIMLQRFESDGSVLIRSEDCS